MKFTTKHHTFPARVVGRVLSHVVADGDCLNSTYATSAGYAYIRWGTGGSESASAPCHRVAWFAANGEIPPDMTIDHICRNRICVNFVHLRLMTLAENAQLNGHSIKTHCKWGHAFDDANTIVRIKQSPTGTTWRGRTCRACISNRQKIARPTKGGKKIKT